MSVYPPVDMILAGSNPAALLKVQRSLRSVASDLAMFGVAVIAVYIFNLIFHGAAPWSELPVARHISLRWLAVGPAIILVEVIRKYHDDLYIFTAHYVTHYEGRLSLSSSTPSIKYEDIRSIVVKQDIWGRLLNYGNVELSSAAESTAELILSGIRAPRELLLLVENLRVKSALERVKPLQPTLPEEELSASAA